jgi:hypothetical protein
MPAGSYPVNVPAHTEVVVEDFGGKPTISAEAAASL